VPKSEGNARAEDVSKHSAVSRGEIAECGWAGRSGNIVPKPLGRVQRVVIFLCVLRALCGFPKSMFRKIIKTLLPAQEILSIINSP